MAFDERTEKNIATLLPGAQVWARKFVEACLGAGHQIRIISGNRTYAEQDKLYEIGRRGIHGEATVTNARGGQSNHNFGIAWDIGVFTGGTYHPESSEYAKCGVIGRELGLGWGGDWISIKDMPHYEVKTVGNLSLASLRGLIHDHKPIPLVALAGPAPAPVPVVSKPVTVLLSGVDMHVPAFFDQSRVWVAARPFTEKLGGAIDSVLDNPFRIKLVLNGEEATVEGKMVGNAGYAKFADLNALLDYQFVFDGIHGQLKLEP